MVYVEIGAFIEPVVSGVWCRVREVVMDVGEADAIALLGLIPSSNSTYGACTYSVSKRSSPGNGGMAQLDQ
jgi:hypothetical protein